MNTETGPPKKPQAVPTVSSYTVSQDNAGDGGTAMNRPGNTAMTERRKKKSMKSDMYGLRTLYAQTMA